MKGLYLSSRHAHYVLGKKKTLVIRATDSSDFSDKELLLLSKHKVHGIVKLEAPVKVSLEEFTKLEKQHFITDEERKKWWPKATELYSYKIDLLRSFLPTMSWKMPETVKMFVDDVDVNKTVTIKMPIEFLEDKHLKRLSDKDVIGLHHRVHMLYKLVGDTEKLTDAHDQIKGEMSRRKIKHQSMSRLDTEREVTIDETTKHWLSTWSALFPHGAKGEFSFVNNSLLFKTDRSMFGFALEKSTLDATSMSQHVRLEGKWLSEGSEVTQGDVVDKGEYTVGVARNLFFEVFLKGEKLNGRYIIQYSPQCFAKSLLKAALDVNYRKFRSDVLARDHFQCQKCGSTEFLTVHHLVPRRDDVTQLLAVENGQTLCWKCHDDINKAEAAQRVWLISKPKDQLPYAKSHKLENVLTDIKARDEIFLVWSDGVTKTECYKLKSRQTT